MNFSKKKKRATLSFPFYVFLCVLGLFRLALAKRLLLCSLAFCLLDQYRLRAMLCANVVERIDRLGNLFCLTLARFELTVSQSSKLLVKTVPSGFKRPELQLHRRVVHKLARLFLCLLCRVSEIFTDLLPICHMFSPFGRSLLRPLSNFLIFIIQQKSRFVKRR